jgi:hypothetical protein
MAGTKSILALSILFATAAPRLNAQASISFKGSEPRAVLTPAEKKFVDSYLAAVKSPDIERYKRLLHPATRACMNAQTSDYFQDIFKRRVNRVVTSPKFSVQDVPAKFGMFDYMEAHDFHYDVKPTLAFNMDLVSTGDNQESITAFAALDKGTWYEVLPCPTAKAMAALQKNRGSNDPEMLKARVRVEMLKDPLRGEMLADIKQGHRASAAKRYSDANHVDLKMASRVVDILATLAH